MTATNFDTLAYAKKLREAGFTEQQAESQAEALRAVIVENLATKSDIAAIQHDIESLRRDIKELESRLRIEIEHVRRDMKEVESRITIRLGGLIVAGVGVVAVLMRLL